MGGAALTTLIAIAEPFLGDASTGSASDQQLPFGFTWGIAVWLWLTVFFANIAESVAEGRGKAQAATLRKTRTTTSARRVVSYDATADPAASGASTEDVPSGDLRVGDVVLVETGSSSPATATSSTASRRSTSRRSRASRPRSCASRAATAAPSPAGRAC